MVLTEYMKQSGKILLLVMALILSGSFAQFASGQSAPNRDKSLQIYDGRWDRRSPFAPKPIIEVPREMSYSYAIKSAEKHISAKSSEIKTVGLEIIKSGEPTKASINCEKYKKNEVISDFAEGLHVTKLHSSEVVFLYKLYFCGESQKSSEQIGGILAFGRDGKINAHYVYAGTTFSHLTILPDINRNYLCELILSRGDNEIDLVEIGDNKIKYYGSFEDVFSYGGGQNGRTSVYKGKKIYAIPGENPEFSQESYTKKDLEEWKLTKAGERVFLNTSLDWSKNFRPLE